MAEEFASSKTRRVPEDPDPVPEAVRNHREVDPDPDPAPRKTTSPDRAVLTEIDFADILLKDPDDLTVFSMEREQWRTLSKQKCV